MASASSSSTSSSANSGNLLNMQGSQIAGTKLLTPMKMELSVKLDHNNYLLWRQQVLAAIKGARLSTYIDSTVNPPSKVNDDGSISDKYLDWEQQDQFLMCWLLASISQELLPELVGCENASAVWMTIEKLFASQSTANLMQLKLQLHTLKKGNMTMSEYLMKKKSIMDALAFTGNTMTDADKIMSILGGLGPDYDSFVISVTSMPNLYTMTQISALLMTHEARMNLHTQMETLSVNIATNKVANSDSGENKGNKNNLNGAGRGNSGGRRGRGRGRGRFSGGGRIPCQICFRTNHDAS